MFLDQKANKKIKNIDHDYKQTLGVSKCELSRHFQKLLQNTKTLQKSAIRCINKYNFCNILPELVAADIQLMKYRQKQKSISKGVARTQV